MVLIGALVIAPAVFASSAASAVGSSLAAPMASPSPSGINSGEDSPADPTDVEWEVEPSPSPSTALSDDTDQGQSPDAAEVETPDETADTQTTEETASDDVLPDATQTATAITPDEDGWSGDEALERPQLDTSPAETSMVAPLNVPAPTPTTAVVTVKVGGDRAPNGAVNPLAGVQLGLYGAGTATAGGSTIPTQGVPGARYNASWSWTTCASNADGDCSFVIPVSTSTAGTPSATSVPQDTRFWVIEEASPEGWYSNPRMRLGGFGATPEATWEYRFRTDVQLRRNTLYSSTTPMLWTGNASDPDRGFMRNRVDSNQEGSYAANVGRTTGVWSQSRQNPGALGVCPTNIALIADTSGSLGAAGISSLKSTMSAFVDQLRGTNAHLSLFSFSELSPGAGATNHPALMPVTTSAQAAAFKAQYAGWVSGGGTNWDAGFATVANTATVYDFAILLTDGNPTVIRNNTGVGSSAYSSFQDVDAGIFSANQLKEKGTRVLALGIGPAFTGASEYNLRAVSGTTAGTDYFRASSFEAATTYLVELARKNCGGSIGVQKMIVPEGGTTANAVPAPAGWEFEASASSPAVVVPAPSTRTTSATSNGKVDFPLVYPPGSTSGNVQVLETQQVGYELFPVNGANAVCTNVNTGQPVAVTNTGTAARPGFAVTTQQSERVECTIYNRLVSAELELEKVDASDPQTPLAGASFQLWNDVNANGTLETGIDTPVGSPQTTDAGGRLTWTSGLHPGAYLLEETTPPSGYEIVGTGIHAVTLESTKTTIVVENSRQLGSVTWRKVDTDDRPLGGSRWTLIGPNGASSSSLLVDDCIEAPCVGADQDARPGHFKLTDLAWGDYTLSESMAPAGYVLDTTPHSLAISRDLRDVALGSFVNHQRPALALPLTGGTGTETFVIFGGLLISLLVAGAGYRARRLRSQHAA